MVREAPLLFFCDVDGMASVSCRLERLFGAFTFADLRFEEERDDKWQKITL